ncbi:MAG: hypothetical protein MH204_07265 [Fimbriimonadaceae bacterium]|nr:hypothetical protein [Fimbriimonadaceae bacterium]
MNRPTLRILPLFICLAAGLAAGCMSEEAAPADPDKGTLTGSVDKSLAGQYKTQAGMNYTLNEDGSFLMKGQVQTPGGMIDRETKGEWRVDGDKLMIKDAQGYVVPYAMTKESNGTIKLVMTGRMKAETILTPVK